MFLTPDFRGCTSLQPDISRCSVKHSSAQTARPCFPTKRNSTITREYEERHGIQRLKGIRIYTRGAPVAKGLSLHGLATLTTHSRITSAYARSLRSGRSSRTAAGPAQPREETSQKKREAEGAMNQRTNEVYPASTTNGFPNDRARTCSRYSRPTSSPLARTFRHWKEAEQKTDHKMLVYDSTSRRTRGNSTNAVHNTNAVIKHNCYNFPSKKV